MYKTAEEAKAAVLEIITKRSYKRIVFVVTERKMSKTDKFTWYGFRVLVNEGFNPFWNEEKDYSWSRMVELIAA